MQDLEHFCNAFKGTIYAIFIWFGISTGVVEVLFYLMMIDMFLGVIKALRLGYQFSFKVLMWGMISKLMLLFIPMVLALMAKGLDFDFSYFVIAVMNVMIVNEGISCITNILSIKTKKRIENTDYITMLLNAIRAGLMRIISRLFRVISQGKEKD